MEILDIYDKHAFLTGKTIVRGNKDLREDEYIMLAVVFIKNIKNQFLIQKTSSEKGGKFSSTGGHVLHGESAKEAVIREIREELDYNVDVNNVKFIDKVIIKNKPCIFNIFYLEENIEIERLKLQIEEVEKVVWLSKEEILKLIDDKKFLESHGILFKYIK